MAFGILMLLLILGAALAFWLPKHRLKRAVAQPFPRAYAKILHRNLPLFSSMPADLQLQLKRLIQQFLLQKKFVGCDGLVMSDEIRVTIAGKACLLLLNRPAARPVPVFPRLAFVLVYPSAFVVPRSEVDAAGLVTDHEHTLLGESWDDDRVILAWDHILASSSDTDAGHDVVLHEFAHQLDSESGPTDGAPDLASAAQYARWSAVFTREFAQLRENAGQEIEGVIDPYGANSPAEFFAVATEAFFMRAQALGQEHPALFAALQEYYCVDPREWR